MFGGSDHTFAKYIAELLEESQITTGSDDIVIFLKDTAIQNAKFVKSQRR